MKSEEIIELALEAGFAISTAYGKSEHKLMPISDIATLATFAYLVAKQERARCANLPFFTMDIDEVAEAIRALP
jgi:hypothetical protein